MIDRSRASHDNHQKILTAYEVSAILKIPLSTLYGLSKTGKLKAVKVGKHWRYLADDIDKYLRGFSGDTILNSKLSIVSPEKTDQRSAPRINCELFAKITVLLQRKNEFDKTGLIYNLSESGALFINESQDSYIQVGDPVKVAVDIEISAGIFQKVELIGRIVRFIPGERPQFGIKFKNLSAACREAIKNYVG